MIPQYVIPNKCVQYLQIEVFIFTIVYLLVNFNQGASFYVVFIISRSFENENKWDTCDTFKLGYIDIKIFIRDRCMIKTKSKREI